MADFKNTIILDDGYLQLPVGTTAQRPESPVNGDIRFNSQFKVVENYINGAWKYMPPIVEDGLVLHLDAAEPASYSGSGTTWTDLSGNGNNGTLVNDPTYDTGNAGSLNFDGTDDYVTINGTSIDFSIEQTIFMILKPEESDGNRRNPYNQAYGGYGTITHEIAGNFSYYHGTNGGNGSPYQGTGSVFTVGQNEIAMITLTRNSSIVSWYKNGILENSQTNSYPTTVSSTTTILLADGYTNNYLGKIYFCALYDRALSAAEIQQNFNALRGRYGI